MQDKLAAALTVAVEALCNSQQSRYDDRAMRDKLFADTLAIVRDLVGVEYRLTSMERKCMCCQEIIGTKEGNGSTGETATICHPCMEANWPEQYAVIKSQGGVA